MAYEKPRFAGHQYLLEEGAYQYWKDWGGYSEDLQSLRPVLGVSFKIMCYLLLGPSETIFSHLPLMFLFASTGLCKLPHDNVQ